METYAKETNSGYFAAGKRQNIYFKTVGKAVEACSVFGQGYPYYTVKAYICSGKWVETFPEVVHERMICRNSERDTWKLAHWDEDLAECNFNIPSNLDDNV